MDRFRASVEAVRRGEEPPADGYHGAYLADLAREPGDPVPAMRERIEDSLERFRIHFDSWANQSEIEQRVQELLPRLDTEYGRLYYGALICERRARAHLSASANTLAHAWFVTALREFDRAIAVRPAGNDDAILRWNACARSVNRMTQPASEPQPYEAAIMSE
jgi:hypothetical protein